METQRHQVHPLTPILTGIRFIVLAGVAILANSFELVRLFFTWLREDTLWAMLALTGGFVLLVLVVGLFSWISWKYRFYELSDEEVRIGAGWLFRTRRNARFDRVQAIDINQPLLARLVGLAELKVETAGGQNSDLTIKYLKVDQCKALRQEILEATRRGKQEAALSPTETDGESWALAPSHGKTESVTADGETAASVEPQHETVLNGPVDPVKLFVSLILSPILLRGVLFAVGLIVVGIIIVVLAATKLSWAGVVGVAGGSLLTTGISLAIYLAAIVMIVWGLWSTSYGFTLSTDDEAERLHIRAGLLSTRRQTIPIHRLHGFRVIQPLWWKRRQWAKAHISVAGYGADEQAPTALIPVDDTVRVDETVDQIIDRITEQPRLAPELTLASPRQARWLSPIDWKQQKVIVGPRALVVTHGRLWNVTTIVPWDRIQGFTTHTGPISKALGLVTVEIDMVPGPVKPKARQLSLADAEKLVSIVNARHVR